MRPLVGNCLTPGGRFDGSASGSVAAGGSGAGSSAGAGGGGGGGGGGAGSGAAAAIGAGNEGVRAVGGGLGFVGADATAAGAGGAVNSAIDSVVCVGSVGSAIAISRRTPVIATTCITSTMPSTSAPRQKGRPGQRVLIFRGLIVCRELRCCLASVDVPAEGGTHR